MVKAVEKWEPVNQAEVNKCLADENFIHKTHCGCGLPIHSFRIVNESIQGRLRPCKHWDRADRARTADILWPTKEGKEQGVSIRLSSMLWRAIQENHLWGCWIRITYKGSIRGKFPNALKVYLVEVDRGKLAEDWHTVEAHPADSKNRKPRKKRPIKRPIKTKE